MHRDESPNWKSRVSMRLLCPLRGGYQPMSRIGFGGFMTVVLAAAGSFGPRWPNAGWWADYAEGHFL